MKREKEVTMPTKNKWKDEKSEGIKSFEHEGIIYMNYIEIKSLTIILN